MRKRKLLVICDGEGDGEEGTAAGKGWGKLILSQLDAPAQDADRGSRCDFSGQERDGRAWADKYAPQALSELLVHRQRVTQVREWLQNQITGDASAGMLLLSGPPGVGKSSVVHVLAQVLAFELCEWTTPVPTLWQEHLHSAGAGAGSSGYVSKMQEFEEFLEAARKYPSLSAGVGGGAGKVILIDDVPLAGGSREKERLLQALRSHMLTTLFPTILVLTESPCGQRGEVSGAVLQIQQALDGWGATTISFNPVTAAGIRKLLVKIAGVEGCKVPLNSLALVAEDCGGDVRSALSCLQFLCLGFLQHGAAHVGQSNAACVGNPKNGRRGRKRKSDGVASASQELSISTSLGRDCGLALFHALGKLLYNKRLVEGTVGGCRTPRLLPRYARCPLDMEEPETILARASQDSTKILAFLQENLLDFLEEEAMDDTADVTAYLSDSDLLLGSKGNSWSSNVFASTPLQEAVLIDGGGILGSAAGSVAGRGVLFGNAHVTPRKWKALRAPALWQVEKSTSRTRAELQAQRLASFSSFSAFSATVTATEIRPFSQRLRMLSSWYCEEFKQMAALVDKKSVWEQGASQGDETMEAEFCHFNLLELDMDRDRDRNLSPLVRQEEEDEIQDW